MAVAGSVRTMQHRRLGNSGLKVSEISYGNWITHGSQVGDEAALACVARAVELGITTFDTADVYAGTKAEVVLGKALAGLRRHDIEIFTKVYWPTSAGPNGRGLSRKHIMESIDGSLRRLGTDYVDLYQAHRYDFETPLEETMVAFADVVRAGKALYIGVSEWTAEQIRAGAALAAELRVPFISNQPQYSMLWRVIEDEVIPTSDEVGVGQIVWSPMAQGVLTGKYQPGAPVPEASRAEDPNGGANFVARWLRPEVLEAVAGLVPLADQAGLSMPQMAVAWVLRQPNVASAIVGASRPDQLDGSVAASGVVLDDDLLAAIDDVLDGVVISDPAETAKASPPQRP
jgi:aryl-alcohol dehydrogenase-like predicted oxidoreductase